jgi:hypothetical protein
MEGLLNDLWGADGMSNTYVVLSSVILRNDAGAEKNRKQINEQYKYVLTISCSGNRVQLVEFSACPILTMCSF